MNDYISLRQSQADLLGQIKSFVARYADNGKDYSDLELDHLKNQLDGFKGKSDENDQLLVKLAAATPALNSRSYFKENVFNELNDLIKTALERWVELRKKFNSKKDMTLTEPTLASMMRQLSLMESELSLLKSSKSDSLLADLIKEFKACQNPLKFPSFPREKVYVSYRDWRANVTCFSESNMMPNGVKVQHLKNACKNSEADALMSLVNVNVNFETALKMLDDRYMVPIAIINEFLSVCVEIDPCYQKDQQSDHLKTVLDSFNGLYINLELICKHSLSGKGQENPSKESLYETMLNAVFMALITRTLDDSLKVYLTSKLNLGALEIPDFERALKVMESRLAATSGNDTFSRN